MKYEKRQRKHVEGSVAFGVMDGIVTLLGVLIAMFAVNADQQTVLVAAIATAIADSTANAAGYHVSEEAGSKKKHGAAIRSSIFCFVATFIAIMIPTIPVIFFSFPFSFYFATAIGLIILFALGTYIESWKVGLEYLLIGAAAGIFCYIVGSIV
jgi:VIT1/CCC1 family predicted Fe2+/Mn2+ transporter